MEQVDYKGKYEDLIERIKKMVNCQPTITKLAIESLFPEITESEDERIRKELIDFVKSRLAGFPDCKRFTDWLEKQGEQKPNFCHHEVDLSNCSEEYRKAYYDGWNNCNQQHSQLKAMQRPLWSEENEAVLDALIRRLEGEEVCVSPHLAVDCLKSLKDRVQQQNSWKPSDEQMEALSNALSLAKNCGEESAFDLRILYEQLKQL